VRSLVVVDLAPRIESFLTDVQIVECATLDYFGFQRAVEPLVLALGLGDGRLGRDSRRCPVESNQTAKPEYRWPEPAVPQGAPFVAEYPLREPVAAEQRREVPPDRRVLLVVTGHQPDGVPRVVVQDGQRVAAARASGEVPLEVHLPEPIGGVVLEADEGRGRRRVRG